MAISLGILVAAFSLARYARTDYQGAAFWTMKQYKKIFPRKMSILSFISVAMPNASWSP
jgi:hypothetical protein